MFNAAGYTSLFFFFRESAQEEMRRAPAASGDRVTIVISRNAEAARLSWISEDEFWYEGRLYDVFRTDRQEGAIVYTCKNDVREEHLYAGLQGQTIISVGCQNGPKTEKLFSAPADDYILPPSDSEEPQPCFTSPAGTTDETPSPGQAAPPGLPPEA